MLPMEPGSLVMERHMLREIKRLAEELPPGLAACSVCLRATTTPACQPGARPPRGGRIASTSIPLLAITHAITAFEFHISPAASSSRPQTGVGTFGTVTSTRRAHPSSSLSRTGLSTASETSGMWPPRQTRIS